MVTDSSCTLSKVRVEKILAVASVVDTIVDKQLDHDS